MKEEYVNEYDNWKEKVYRKKSKQQIINDAFGRWKDAGYNYNNY